MLLTMQPPEGFLRLLCRLRGRSDLAAVSQKKQRSALQAMAGGQTTDGPVVRFHCWQAAANGQCLGIQVRPFSFDHRHLD
jgi:hypothetical protein